MLYRKTDKCASGCVSQSLQYIWRWLKVFLSGQMFVVIFLASLAILSEKGIIFDKLVIG